MKAWRRRERTRKGPPVTGYRIPEELKRELAELAEEGETTASELVARAARRFVDDCRKVARERPHLPMRRVIDRKAKYARAASSSRAA